LSSENIEIGSTTIAGIWTVASMVAKAPEYAAVGIVASLSFIDVWKLITAKIEKRRNDKQE